MPEPEKINQQEIMAYYGYKGKIGTLKYYLSYVIGWSLQKLAKFSPHPGLAILLHRIRGVHIGKHVYIGPDVNIDDLYPGLITIEDYVSIGMRTMIFAHSNPTCSIELKSKYYPREVKPTVIKNGAWIAPGCIIQAGVTIGENSVVGAGSIVSHNIPPNCVAVGFPARVVRKLE